MELVDLGLIVAAVTGFLAWYLILLLVTRPAGVAADPATLDLGTEPPAVAGVLASRWTVPAEAAGATLLDLAVSGHLELRQAGNEPRQTTVHLTGRPADQLLPFERRVLDRVAEVAMDGVVPVTALTFHDAAHAAAWHNLLRADILAEARRLDLSRPRLSRAQATALSLGALGAATVVAGAVVHAGLTRAGRPSVAGAVCPALIAWIVVAAAFGALCARRYGERDTPAGREAARRWLGVRRWLRAQDSFAELPPAAVAVWDRYLPYGAALGVTRVASGILNLDFGDRKRRWSRYGDGWRPVTVRYPRLWPHYGKRAAELAKPGAQAVLAGLALIVFNQGPRAWLPALLGDDVIDPWVFDVFEPLAAVAGLVLLPLGVVRLLFVLVDVLSRRRIRGEVLWTEPWPDTWLGRSRAGRTYLAVDDGTADRTTAWAMPSPLYCEVGDVVSITVRRWTRRVIDLRMH